MLELTLTAAAPSQRARIQTGISKLLFKGTFAKSADDDTDAEIISAFKAAYPSTATMEITRYQKDGTKNMVNVTPLADLAEIAAANEGFIKIDTLTSTSASVEFSIELSNAGDIEASQAEYMDVSFAGCTATQTLVYSTSSPIEGPEYIKYEPKAVQANGEVNVPVSAAYAIAIPHASVTNMDITYPNGKVAKFKAAEIPLIAADHNEVTYVVNGNIVTLGTWFVMGVTLATSVRLTLSAEKTIYILSNVSN